jgi:hypothetical protein
VMLFGILWQCVMLARVRVGRSVRREFVKRTLNTALLVNLGKSSSLQCTEILH